MITDPALDNYSLQGMLNSPRRKDRQRQALIGISDHLEHYPDTFVSFSGGKDSAAVVSLATSIYPQIPVCFFDSGLELPENVDYIHSLAESMDLNLHVIKAKALDWLEDTGWFNHYAGWLDPKASLNDVKIQFPSEEAHSKHGQGRLWGLRADESKGRSALLLPHKGVTRYQSGQIAYAPLWNWNAEEVQSYLSRNRIPKNPVYTKLTELGVPQKEQRVGAAFDSGLDFGRMTWLKRGWPHIYARLLEHLPRLEEYR